MGKKQLLAIGICAILTAVYFGIKIYTVNIAKIEVNKVIANLSDVADIKYENVDVNLFNMSVIISDILISPIDTNSIGTNSIDKTDNTMKIKEIIIYDITYNRNMPVLLSVMCREIELSVEHLGEMGKKLNTLGYNDKITTDLFVNYTYDLEKNELNIKNSGIKAKNVGEIIINLNISDINLAPEAIIGIFFTFPQIMLHNAKVEYKDDSLFERFLKLTADKEHINVTDFKNFIITKIKQDIKQENDTFIRTVLSKIENFIEDPDELSITAYPASPVSISSILSVNSPKDCIKMLNLQIQ